MSSASSPAERARLAVVAAVLLVSVGGLGWWFGPWNEANRYRKTSLVSLRRIVESQPQNRLAWREIGLRLAGDGDGTMAEPALREALRLDAADVEVATGLGEILLARGATEEAFQILSAVVGRRPDYAPGRMALGRLYRRKGAYQRAAEQFETVASQHVGFPDASYQLAVCFLQMQQVSKASTAIDRALAESPDEPEYLSVRAAVHAAIGEVDQALASLTHAAELAPTSVRTQASLASMLLAHQRGPDDLALADRAISQLEKLRPDHPLLPYLHGRRAMLKQQWAAAVEALEAARESTPSQDEVYYSLSQSYRRVGRKADAATALAEYRRRDNLRRRINQVQIRLAETKDQLPLYRELAELQLKLGDVGSARASLTAAQVIAPNDADLRRRLDELAAALTGGGAQP
jgi:predicted Zn-dependent protease